MVRVARRAFLQGSGAMAFRMVLAGGALSGLMLVPGSEVAPAGARGRLGLVRPPGSLSEADFLARCIRCTRCTDACEAGCIALFGPEAGRQHGTPYIVPATRGCTLCMACGTACPTGAIVPLSAPNEVAMGVAIVDDRLCVSLNGTGVCGACFTACPLRGSAITQDFRNAPVVHDEACVGCGLCEEFCIVRDRRAIQVHTQRRWGRGESARTIGGIA